MTRAISSAASTPSSRYLTPSARGDILSSVKQIVTSELRQWGDADLLYRIGRGDRRAFRIFYHRHAGRILVLLKQRCSDRALAEDLVQEVFLLVWRKAASYHESRGEALGWLFTIARNKMIDQRRRAGARIEEDEEELGTWPASNDVHRDVRLSLEQAISSLTTDQQRALRMTYYGGYTYEEAASRLQVPLGTLKSRLKTGLQRLRSTFEGALQ